MTPATEPISLAAECIHDVERRFLSALWNVPIDGYNAAVRHGLSGDSFSNNEHAELYAALAARAVNFDATGCIWSAEAIRSTLALVGVVLTAGDGSDELTRILNGESSGAGASNYAKLIAFYERKRRQARRLHRTLRDIPDEVLGAGARPVIRVVRRKSGAA